MKRIALLLAASTCLGLPLAAYAQTAPAAGHEQSAELPRYTAAQFYQTTSYGMASPSGYAFSPDGSQLLISSDASGVFNVWLMPLAGGDPVAVTTSEADATFADSFFPSDGRILFNADSGGNELNHVYVRELDGSVRDLTPGDELKADFYGWSADGETMFIATNERDPQAFDLYAYATNGYARQMIFENSGMLIGAVSPDGDHVALIQPITSANSNLYLVDLAGSAEPFLITEHDGNVNYSIEGFTRDGSALVYDTDEAGEYSQAWRYTMADGAKTPMIVADWDVMFVTYSPSGRYRVHGVNADASTQITITDTQTGGPVTLTGVPAGDLGGVRFSQDESSMAFTVASDTSPTDIFVADVASGAARRMTTALNPAIDEGQLVEAEVVRFASYDGMAIPGILYRPRGAAAGHPVPAIVYVHGGPGGQTRRGYSPTIQHLVNHGYAVYGINNRGSSGYGKTFNHLDDRHHGDVDLRDVVAAGDWLRSLDWVEDDAVAVMGGSYGGYMTAAALTFHPQAFDAGIDIFGVTNWVRTLESIPPWWGAFREALYDEMGDPATDAERHRAISPLFHAANIERPLLVIQGANDPRVLQVESDELVEAARAGGTPVEYVVFPDEGHGFLRKENRITASEAYLRFLDEHLGE